MKGCRGAHKALVQRWLSERLIERKSNGGWAHGKHLGGLSACKERVSDGCVGQESREMCEERRRPADQKNNPSDGPKTCQESCKGLVTWGLGEKIERLASTTRSSSHCKQGDHEKKKKKAASAERYKRKAQ